MTQFKERNSFLTRDNKNILALVGGMKTDLSVIRSDLVIVGNSPSPIMVEGTFEGQGNSDLDVRGVLVYASGVTHGHAVSDELFNLDRGKEYYVYWNSEGWTDPNQELSDTGTGSSSLSVTETFSDITSAPNSRHLLGVYDTQVNDNVPDTMASGTWSPLWMGGTVIDGSRIHTQSITATNIAANTITADEIKLFGVKPSNLQSLLGSAGALNTDPNCSDINAWTKDGGSGTSAETIETITDGEVGTTTIRIAGTGSSWLWNSGSTQSDLIPLDPAKTYRLHVWARQTAGTSTSYLTCDFFDKNGDTINAAIGAATGWTSSGTFHYWLIANAVFPGSWTEYQFTFGPDGTGSFPVNTVAASCRFGVLGNLSQTDDSTIRFQDFRLEEIVSGDRMGAIDVSDMGAIGTKPSTGLVLDSTGLSAYEGGTTDADRTIFLEAATGNTILGKVAANQANLFWDTSGGDLDFRVNEDVKGRIATDGTWRFAEDATSALAVSTNEGMEYTGSALNIIGAAVNIQSNAAWGSAQFAGGLLKLRDASSVTIFEVDPDAASSYMRLYDSGGTGKWFQVSEQNTTLGGNDAGWSVDTIAFASATGAAGMLKSDEEAKMTIWGDFADADTDDSILAWKSGGGVDINYFYDSSTDTFNRDLGNVNVEINTADPQNITTGPKRTVQYGDVATTDATQTTITTFATATGVAYMVIAKVVGHRTGGSSGTADDSGTYMFSRAYVNKSGTLTALGAGDTQISVFEDQAAWGALTIVSGTNLLVRVVGAANNNIDWTAHVEIHETST